LAARPSVRFWLRTSQANLRANRKRRLPSNKTDKTDAPFTPHTRSVGSSSLRAATNNSPTEDLFCPFGRGGFRPAERALVVSVPVYIAVKFLSSALSKLSAARVLTTRSRNPRGRLARDHVSNFGSPLLT
jgi:hypothetical protein